MFGGLALKGFIWLLLFGTVLPQRGGITKTTTLVGQMSEGNSKQVEVIGEKDKVFHPQMDLNYMSKRRVPNGPDPIHNRRTGNSGRPPGQA